MNLLETLDDRMNPVVVKELRQAVRARSVTGLVMLFLAVQLFVISQVLFSYYDQGAGRRVFEPIMAVLSFTGILCLPAYTGFRLSSERSDSHGDLLFITTLTPFRFVFGKFLASLALCFLIYSACLPFLCVSYLLRGIDMDRVGWSVLGSFLAVVFALQGSVFVGCVPGNRVGRGLLGIGAAFGLLLLWLMMLEFNEDLLRRGLDGSYFWDVFLVGFGMILGTGFLFVAASALVSPHQSNRALPIRIFLLLACLSSFGVSLWITRQAGHHDALVFWAVLSTLFCCAGLFMAISERDGRGGRLRAQIPKNRLLRFASFFFFSGSAGGVLFFSLLGCAVVCLALLGREWTGGPWRSYEIIACLGLLLGFLAYAMTALWMQRVFLSKRIEKIYNWVFAGVLLGAGSLLPFIVLQLFFGMRDRDLPPWFGIPFALFEHSREESQTVLLIWFGGWSILALFLNLRWFWRQIRDFWGFGALKER